MQSEKFVFFFYSLPRKFDANPRMFITFKYNSESQLVMICKNISGQIKKNNFTAEEYIKKKVILKCELYVFKNNRVKFIFIAILDSF